MIRQGVQTRCQRLRGKIRLGDAIVEQQVAGILNNEPLALCALGRMPADSFVAILQRLAARPPGQESHPHAQPRTTACRSHPRRFGRAEIM